MVNLLGTLQSRWRGRAMLRCSAKGCPAVKGPRARSGRLFPGNPGVCSAPGGLSTPRRNPSPRSEPRAVHTPSFIRVIESPSPPPPGAPPSRRGTAGGPGTPRRGSGRRPAVLSGGRGASGWPRGRQAAARGAGRRGSAHRPRGGPPPAGAPGLSHPARDAPPAPSHMTPPPPQTFSSHPVAARKEWKMAA